MTGLDFHRVMERLAQVDQQLTALDAVFASLPPPRP